MLNQPYAFQTGKHQSKAMELMMFNDYGWLNWWLLNKLNPESQTGKNVVHRHLEELIQKGETRQPKKICPQCGQKPVKFFFVQRYDDGSFSIGARWTCCEDENCKQVLRGETNGENIEFLPFRFSMLLEFRSQAGRKKVVGLFKKVFGLPERLTRKAACKFFDE